MGVFYPKWTLFLYTKAPKCAKLNREMAKDKTELLSRFKVDGELISANKAFSSLFGEKRSKLIGLNLTSLVA